MSDHVTIRRSTRPKIPPTIYTDNDTLTVRARKRTRISNSRSSTHSLPIFTSSSEWPHDDTPSSHDPESTEPPNVSGLSCPASTDSVSLPVIVAAETTARMVESLPPIVALATPPPHIVDQTTRPLQPTGHVLESVPPPIYTVTLTPHLMEPTGRVVEGTAHVVESRTKTLPDASTLSSAPPPPRDPRTIPPTAAILSNSFAPLPRPTPDTTTASSVATTRSGESTTLDDAVSHPSYSRPFSDAEVARLRGVAQSKEWKFRQHDSDLRALAGELKVPMSVISTYFHRRRPATHRRPRQLRFNATPMGTSSIGIVASPTLPPRAAAMLHRRRRPSYSRLPRHIPPPIRLRETFRPLSPRLSRLSRRLPPLDRL